MFVTSSACVTVTVTKSLRRLGLSSPRTKFPPPDVAGYGLVVLPQKATPANKDRLLMLCRSFVATLAPQQNLPFGFPRDRALVTIWPLDDKKVTNLNQEDCEVLLDHYDLLTGESNASIQVGGLSGRGPFLIGWVPSNSRHIRDAVVLVVDMSNFDTQASFDDALLFWKKKMIENPALWKRGFSVELIRLVIRDFVDHYGSSIIEALKFEHP